MFQKELTLEHLNQLNQGFLPMHMGIEFTEIGENYLCAKMPVVNHNKQPYGILHGGASVVLAETLGSVGASYAVDLTKFKCVGLEINANHIRPATQGFVHGKATPIHIGKTTHIWEIRITDDNDKLTCISRITMAVIPM